MNKEEILERSRRENLMIALSQLALAVLSFGTFVMRLVR